MKSINYNPQGNFVWEYEDIYRWVTSKRRIEVGNVPGWGYLKYFIRSKLNRDYYR